MKRRTGKKILTAIALIQVLYTSCEIGLGSAVDTRAPDITIDRPEVDMVIRDRFVMSGEWNDDGTIDEVYVLLKRTDGNAINPGRQGEEEKKEIKIEGTFEKDLLEKEKGTWKAEVDPFDEENPIPDGTYQATIVIKDKGKHTTSQSTTFTIDNTAPVLILTKPVSKPGDSTTSKYGKRLFLEGKIADSTKETWIEINFYGDEECSEESLLTTMQTQLIAPTDVNSNNAKLASFSEDLSDELAAEYREIYRDENGEYKEGKAGSSTVYATLTVYDTAETCKDEEEGDGNGAESVSGKVRGNSTGTFYFSKELSSSITKSKESGGYGLAPTDIYNILNGNYKLKDSSRAAEAENVTKELKDLRKDREGDKDVTVFTINPENSPYFTVSGLKTLSGQSMEVSDNGYFLINGAMTLEISVFMGSDSIEIDSDSEDFYAYLLESDEYGEPKEGAEQIKLYSKARESGSGKDKKTYYEIGGKEEHQTTTGAYVFSVPMAKTVRANPDAEGSDGTVQTGIEYGKNYVIRVSGKDMEDNPIEEYDTGYGFHFTSGGGAPELEIEEPGEGTLFVKKAEKEEDAITFTGRAKTEEGIPEVTVWNGNEKIAELELLTQDEGKFNRFSGKVKLLSETFDQENGGIYTLTVKAASRGDNEGATEYQRTVWYDTEEPKASNIKVSEKKEGEEYKDSYTDGTDYYVNNQKRKIGISGVATDNVGVKGASLIIRGEGGEEIRKEDNDNAGKWSFRDIDLRSWSGKKAEAEIILEDKSGNKSTTKIVIKFDVTEPQAEHQIDDSNKDLSFRIGDYANDKGESDVGGKYSFGTYGSALTMQIRGNFPDEEGGSGIKKIYYKVFEDEVTIDKTKENGEKSGGKIYFKSLEDLKDYVTANKTDTFTPLGEAETRNVEYNIKPASDITQTVDRLGGKPVNGYTLTSKGYVQFSKAVKSNYKTTIKGFEEGKNYLVLVAEDNAGNMSVDHAEVATPEDPSVTAIYPCYSLNVDVKAPSIPSKQEGTVYTNLGGNTAVTISGTVSDKSEKQDGSSGLNKIVFTSDQNNKSVTVYASDFRDVTEVENPDGDVTLKKWSADIRTLLSKDGTAIISAKVTDNAGYETSQPVANVMVDRTAPVVSINTPAYNAKTGTKVSLSGTVNDGTGAGVDTAKPMVLYYTSNVTMGLAGLTQVPEANEDASKGWVKIDEFTAGASGSWSYETDAAGITTDGENNIRFFTVSAVDKAGEGNTGFAEAVRVTVDRKKPVIDDAVSGIGNQVTADNVNGHWFNASTLKGFGKYTDEGGSGVTSISYRIGEGETEEVSTANGSYSINISDFRDGENTLRVRAEDAAGNVSEETTYTFNIDSVQPVITAVSGRETTKGEDIELSVVIKDENPVEPVVLVKQDGTAAEEGQAVTVEEEGRSGNTTTYKVTVPFETAITADGTYEIEIQESDRAGNRAETVTKKILRDSRAPVITITRPETEDGAYIKAGSYQFEGAVTDAGGVEEAFVTVYKVNGSSETVFETERALDLQADGSWIHKVYELTAGEYRIKVKAKDRAGNEAEEAESPKVQIDNTAPVLTIRSSVTDGKTDLKDSDGNDSTNLLSDRTYYAKGDYQIKVSVNDTNFDFGYEIEDEEGNTKTLYSVTAKDNNQEEKAVRVAPDGNDVKAFIIRPEVYEDGIFTYEIDVHDKAGNQANPSVIKVQRDTTGPEVSIKNPAADITDASLALSEETYSFRIHAADGNGVGVAKLYYAFSQTGPGEGGSIPEGLVWKEEPFTDGDRNVDTALLTGTTAAEENGIITKLCEGNWHLYAKAVDKSGNESVTAVRSFPVDRGDPELTVAGLNDSGVNALYKEIENGKYILSGSVRDTNALAADDAVEIRVDGQSVKTIKAAETGNNGSWEYELLTGTEEGKLKEDTLVSVKVTAKDAAGRTSSKAFTLYYDTKDPVLEVTAPVEGEAVETDTKVIKGTVSDDGYGIKKIEYSLYSGSTLIASGDTDHPDADYPIAIKGEQWYISKNDGKVPLGSTEGSLSLTVTATENKPEGATAVSGTREYVTTKTINFYYDTANPSLEETGIGTRGKTTNAGFTLSGSATDTNALASVEISWGTDNKITLTPSSGQLKSMNWSQAFVVGSATGTNHVADGANDFTIIAKDISGKEKQLTRTVVVDTTPPEVSAPEITVTAGANIAGVDWYKTTSLPIEVTADDEDGSGISKAEYCTSSDGGESWSSWNPLSYSNEKYQGTVSFGSDGKNLKFKVRATDVAGNVSTEIAAHTVTVNVDTSAPVLSVSQSENLYVQSGNSITVNGSYEDAQSGVEKLTFKIDDTEITPQEVKYSSDGSTYKEYDDEGLAKDEIKYWRAVFKPEDSGKFSVQGINRAGDSTSELKAFDITIDSEAPVISNVKFEEVTGETTKDAYLKASDSKYYVNNEGKTFKISGVSTDDTGIQTVELKVTNTAESPAAELTPAMGGSTGKWSFSISGMTDWNAGASAVVTVTDKSGRKTTETLDIVFDKAAPEVPAADAVIIQGETDIGQWFSDNYLSLSGSFNDGLSGVGKVYYKLGSLEAETKTVTPQYINGKYEYSASIDFSEISDKKLYIKAEDNAGNVMSDYTQYVLSIDTTPPVITSDKENETLFTNRKGTITISGTVNDTESGVKSLDIYVGETLIGTDKVTVTVTDTGTGTNAEKKRQNSWTAVIQGSAFPATGTATVYALAKDNTAGSGNTQKAGVVSVTTDIKGPSIKINSPSAAAKVGKDFTISGTAEDGNGAGVSTEKPMVLYYTTNEDLGTAAAAPESITEVSDPENGWVKYTQTAPALTDSEWTCEIDADKLSLDTEGKNKTVYFTVSASDISGTGNTGYAVPRTVTIDLKKPEYDYDYSDLSIGGKTHTQMSSVQWFKDDTLVVKGKFKDEGGSGVTKIFYQVDTKTAVELATTDGTYNTNISGFGADSTLKLWAEDAAGNNTSASPVTYTVKVDKNPPAVTSEISGINYLNGSAAFPVSLTVRDAESGAAGVVLSRDGTNETVTCTLSDGKYKAADIRTLLPESGNATIMATATDNAGNTASTVAANILVDKTEPSVTLTVPADADTSAAGTQVNGTITLGGTSSDENVISRVVGLLYKNADTAEKPAKQTDLSATAELSEWTVPGGWTKVSATLSNANATTNWTFTGVDTTKLDGTNPVAENSSIWFTVAVQDAAGNIGYSDPVQVYAKQDSDRPTITLSQLTKNTYTGTQLDSASVTTLKTKNVYGSVTDDDGTLEKLWYWNGATAPTTAPSYNTTWTVPEGWHEITINGGSWSIDSTENDGQTTWYFAAADANKTVFATVGTDTLTLPYIRYSGEPDKVDGTANGVTFKYDTNPPTATALYLYRAAAGTNTTAAALAEEDAEDPDAIAWSQTQNIAFGKDYDVLYAKVVVNEGTGMKALTDAIAATQTTEAVEMSSPVSISYKNLEFAQIKEVSEGGTYTYYLGPVTMNTTEQHEFKVTVEDDVGNKGYISRNIIVDNEAPVSITETKPKSTVEISDVFTYRGNVSDNTGGSGVTKVEWYIPKSSETDATAVTAWTEASLSAGWEIDFSGTNNLSTRIGYTTSGNTSYVGTDYRGYETSSGSGVYNIPVWFRITDAVGNVGYNTLNAVRYNPNTDRPSVQITSPIHNKTVTLTDNTTVNYAIMGGNAARISGSADDNEGISKVYLQFDLDGDGKWDNGVSGLSADMSALPGNSATLIAGCPWTKGDIKEIKFEDGTSTGYFGIEAGTTKNWSYTLDLSSTSLLHITETKTGEEPDVTYTYTGNTIKVRAIAIDNDTTNGQLVSAPSAVVNVSVNNDIPLFSNLKLKQIEGDNVLTEIDYTDGKYLTGVDWYITGDVYAYGGISSANYTGVTDAKDFFSEKTGSNYTYNMKIPVTPDASGKWDSTITVYDKNDSGAQSNQQRIIIHIDNDAPTFNDTYTGTDVTAYGTAKHYLNSYGARGTLLTPTVKIQDTNGLASIWGRVTDTGSGFDKAVFYFKRFDVDGTSNPRVYNPMEQTDNRTDLESASSVGKIYINDDGLPALVVETDATAKMTVTRPVASDCEIQVTLDEGATVSGVAGNKNVRKGGLIKIGGIYRTITDVDYTDGIVTFDPPCDRSFVTAEIIYAMVVDSTGETMTNNTINEEDGDGMQENFSDVSGTVTWNAAIRTSYIPDGAIQLHVVVFDQSGNHNHAWTNTGISNTPLRLTKVMLGTDLNANGTYDTSSEFETFYAITDSHGDTDVSRGLEVWNLDTRPNETSQYFTVKKGLSVIPEFVGGTGDIYYRFQKRTENLTQAQTLTASDANKLSTTAVAVEGTGNKTGQFSLASGTIGYGTDDEDEDNMHVFSFSFWDSTESSIAGQNSSWTVLNAKIYQDLIDNIAPTVDITPFYWRGKTENSVVWEGGKPLGHIELKDDLPTDKFTTSTTNNGETIETIGEYDRDPKVSGKIKIEGTACDETRLDSITVAFADKKATASYSTSGWSEGTSGSGYILTVSDPYGPTQNGHSVNWTLTVDTGSVVSGKVADVDKTITVTVKDTALGSVAWSGVSDTDKSGIAAGSKIYYSDEELTKIVTSDVVEDETVFYTDSSKTDLLTDTDTVYFKAGTDSTRVDIVPYVTSFTTSLSSFQSSNPSVYDRTALGHYPVYMTHAPTNNNNGTYTYEKVKVNGFNLDDMSITFDEGDDSGGLSKTESLFLVSGNTYSFDLPSGAKTGNVTIGNGSVSTLNNVNNNDACGSVSDPEADVYSGCYNRLPNATNNNLLTDDLVIDVWDFNSAAATPSEGTNFISDIIMKINQNNGMIGFAFSNGMFQWSMGDKSNSYQIWTATIDSIRQTGFAYDSAGNSYGVAAGDNNDTGVADAYSFFTGRWGIVGTNRKTTDHRPTGTKKPLRMECTEQKKTINGVEVTSLNKNRFANSSIATRYNSSDTSTDVYLAFYDAENGEIRFRAGNINTDSKNNFGTFKDSYTTMASQNAGIVSQNYTYNLDSVQIIANNNGDALGNAGEYLCLGVTSENVVVIIWYDTKNNKLMCSYNTDFTYGDLNTKVVETDRVGVSSEGWSVAEELISGAGKYCQLAVDSDNNFHIAAYDGINQDLNYIYIPKKVKTITTGENTNTTVYVPDVSKTKICKVDSYLSVGKELTIDVAKDADGNQIPYIGYYANTPAKPRYAYLADPTSFKAGNCNGVSADKYTGVWECTIVPTPSKMYSDSKRRINVGVWKTTAGVLRNSYYKASGGQDAVGVNNATESRNGDSGKCYGNGTSNAVLAYGVMKSKTDNSTSHIETAQMR